MAIGWILAGILILAGIALYATRDRGGAAAGGGAAYVPGNPGADDPIIDMIAEADAAFPVTSASWRDRNGNRGRYRRAQQQAAQPQLALAPAGGQPGGGWWPVVIGGGQPQNNPPAPAAVLTVNLVTPAPAGGGPATYSVNITGAAGAVTFGMTGLPAGATWGVAPAPFAAPRGGTLIINLPAGATGRATLFAVVGGETLSCGFDLT